MKPLPLNVAEDDLSQTVTSLHCAIIEFSPDTPLTNVLCRTCHLKHLVIDLP